VTTVIFTPVQRELVRLVLNRLIPSSGSFPAAGDLGVADHLDGIAEASPTSRRALLEGFGQIERAAGHGDGFAALSPEAQDAVLTDVERRHPAFFEALVLHAYHGYYSHPAVVRLLGIAGPPQPRGYALEPFDPALVEGVGKRRPLYRV
jgi:hypothetical protein